MFKLKNNTLIIINNKPEEQEIFKKILEYNNIGYNQRKYKQIHYFLYNKTIRRYLRFNEYYYPMVTEIKYENIINDYYKQSKYIINIYNIILKLKLKLIYGSRSLEKR